MIAWLALFLAYCQHRGMVILVGIGGDTLWGSVSGYPGNPKAVERFHTEHRSYSELEHRP